MLVDFTVENYGPFKDKATLSFQATGLSEHEENIIQTDTVKGELLNSLAIFGANASGKSYILRALNTLVRMMRLPLPASMNMMDYAPFRLSPHTKDAPIRMGMRFIDNEILYEYEVSYDLRTILSESLYYYPKKQRAEVFSRKGNTYSFGSGKVSAGQSRISKMTAPNSTYISVASQFNNEICMNVSRFLTRTLILFGDLGNILNNTIRMIDKDEKLKKCLIKALNVADMCINDMEGQVRTKNITDMKDVIPLQMIGLMMAIGNQKVDETVLDLKHNVTTKGLSDKDRSFPFQIESNGTIMMLSVMGPIIHALRNGALIAIDEFGSFLHHEISRWIVSLFKRPGNKHNAQLIINTHDQLLMDTEELFRRDQICFTEKNRDTGASELYYLSDFKDVRKGFDPRKGYELGRFGATPFIKAEDLLDD